MADRLNRGEIWLYQFAKTDKKRPVLVLSRQDVIGLLHTVTVAPITSTIRGLPSEVEVGPGEGLKKRSAVNLDHIQTVESSRLRTYVGSMDRKRMAQVCEAIAIALGCDESMTH